MLMSSFSLNFRYGDMRRLIGFAIRDMWYKLGKKRSAVALYLLETYMFALISSRMLQAFTMLKPFHICRN